MKLKSLNFAVGGGFFYQYLIGVYVVYLITFIDREKVFLDNKESFDKIKEYILTSFGDDFKRKELDVIFEGNGRCFEDINILSKDGDKKTNILLIQVKGGNEGGTRKAINSKEDRVKIILNFLNNKNIYNAGDGTKFLIISNISINHNMWTIFNNSPDLELLTQVICGDIETYLKKEKIPLKTTKIRFLHDYIEKIITGENVTFEKIYGKDLPLKSKEDQDNVELIINNLLIIAKHKVLMVEKVKYLKTIEMLENISSEGKVEEDVMKVFKMSIDDSEIQTKEKDSTNERYFIYDDIYITEENGNALKIKDIDFIKEGKIMKMK